MPVKFRRSSLKSRKSRNYRKSRKSRRSFRRGHRTVRRNRNRNRNRKNRMSRGKVKRTIRRKFMGGTKHLRNRKLKGGTNHVSFLLVRDDAKTKWGVKFYTDGTISELIPGGIAAEAIPIGTGAQGPEGETKRITDNMTLTHVNKTAIGKLVTPNKSLQTIIDGQGLTMNLKFKEELENMGGQIDINIEHPIIIEDLTLLILMNKKNTHIKGIGCIFSSDTFVLPDNVSITSKRLFKTSIDSIQKKVKEAGLEVDDIETFLTVNIKYILIHILGSIVRVLDSDGGEGLYDNNYNYNIELVNPDQNAFKITSPDKISVQFQCTVSNPKIIVMDHDYRQIIHTKRLDQSALSPNSFYIYESTNGIYKWRCKDDAKSLICDNPRVKNVANHLYIHTSEDTKAQDSLTFIEFSKGRLICKSKLFPEEELELLEVLVRLSYKRGLTTIMKPDSTNNSVSIRRFMDGFNVISQERQVRTFVQKDAEIDTLLQMDKYSEEIPYNNKYLHIAPLQSDAIEYFNQHLKEVGDFMFIFTGKELSLIVRVGTSSSSELNYTRYKIVETIEQDIEKKGTSLDIAISNDYPNQIGAFVSEVKSENQQIELGSRVIKINNEDVEEKTRLEIMEDIRRLENGKTVTLKLYKFLLVEKNKSFPSLIDLINELHKLEAAKKNEVPIPKSECTFLNLIQAPTIQIYDPKTLKLEEKLKTMEIGDFFLRKFSSPGRFVIVVKVQNANGFNKYKVIKSPDSERLQLGETPPIEYLNFYDLINNLKINGLPTSGQSVQFKNLLM